ncbi:hypothetical protein, partial [Sphingomonas kyungheensis]
RQTPTSRRPHVPSSNYNVKEPTKTPALRQPSLWEGDTSTRFSVTEAANRVARRCGDAPLGGVIGAVKRFLHFFRHKSRGDGFPRVYAM